MVNISQMRKADKLLPRYQTVSMDIIKRIRDGNLLPGQRLEGMRSLAEHYGVSIQVIYAAVQQLCAASYLHTAPKKGVFVNPRLGHGKYYRIGVFVNELNPALEAYLIAPLYEEAHLAGYELILGSNFEADFAIGEYLAADRTLDGVVLLGRLDEKVIKSVRMEKIPFLVWGNYDLPADVPQYRIDVKPMYLPMLPIFSRFKGQRLAVMLGEKRSFSDREAMDEIVSIARHCGVVCEEKNQIFTMDDGYKPTMELMSDNPPGILYVHGKILRGALQFFAEHPDVVKPHIITNETIFSRGFEADVDEFVKLNDIVGNTAHGAIEALIKQIDSECMC